MQSHEVLKQTMSKVGVKAIASEMNLSTSLLYKWCQPKDGPDAPGADNPMDRLLKICELTEDDRPVRWLCARTGGYYTPNPVASTRYSLPLINATRSILKEFTELLDAVSESIENDGQISEQEAVRIRSEWEDMKSLAESFVHACETGAYSKPDRSFA
jgi:hypothetical protein